MKGQEVKVTTSHNADTGVRVREILNYWIHETMDAAKKNKGQNH